MNLQEIEAMEPRFRANLINSLGGFKSLVLIGTKSREGNENLAPFSSLFHLGASPALCGIIVRPNEEKQNTLGNIIHTKQYTINHVLPAFVRQTHQCSAKYVEGISEFEKTGLTSEYLEDVYAPFVKESRIKFSCEFVQKIDITLNGTFMIIGKIVKIVVPQYFIKQDGYINIEEAGTVTCSGLDCYHTTNKISRFSYAKVDKELKEI